MNINKKIYLSLLIFGFVALVFIFFIIWPLFIGIKESSKELILQKNLLAGLETKAKNLKEFQIIYKNQEQNFQKINEIFIDPKEPIDLIEFLEKEAGNFQLSINMSPASLKKTDDSPWPFMNFQLNLAGSFPDFLKFLERLKSSFYLIEVVNLNISRVIDEEAETVSINATLLIKVHTR